MKERAFIVVMVIGLVLIVSGCMTAPKADVDSFEAHVLETWERYSE